MKIRPLMFTLLSSLVVMMFTGIVAAQVDLSGNWGPRSDQDRAKDGPGPWPDEFAGIPLNANGRAAGLTYPTNQGQELNRQCEPWPITYIMVGPQGERFTPVHDHNGLVIAWHVGSTAYDRLQQTIWMNGHAPPALRALHTYEGFTTGQWEGDTLHTTTTFIKDGYMERNGVPSSNQQTLDLFFTRHGDLMTLMGIVTDPVYLEAPWPLARTLQLILGNNGNLAASGADEILYCQPGEIVPSVADGYHTAVELPPDAAKQAQFLEKTYNLPRAATDGGPQTMYPEFAKTVAPGYRPPSKYCQYLCCMATGRGVKAICEANE
ncbi:MAG TPA: hypothetical protein VN629_09845 [Castellaniella sp.]|nr:hypothetical protein [Castellaniella sp.]